MIITARIEYDYIKALTKGLYAWLVPDDLSKLRILNLMRTAPFKTKDATELHTTVLYSFTNKPDLTTEDLLVGEDKVIPAKINRLDLWLDHKNRNIVVASVVSNRMQQIHNHLIGKGFVSKHKVYNPHITFGYCENNAETRLWIDAVNRNLQKQALVVNYEPYLHGSSLD